jgi:hypothetical protein
MTTSRSLERRGAFMVSLLAVWLVALIIWLAASALAAAGLLGRRK